MTVWLPVLFVIVLLLALAGMWGYQTHRENARKPHDRFGRRITPYGGQREIARRQIQLSRGIIREN